MAETNTLTDKVIALAHEAGREITTEDAGWILWNRTGYTEFFMSDDWEKECLEQVRVYVRGEGKCSECDTKGDFDFGRCDPCMELTFSKTGE